VDNTIKEIVREEISSIIVNSGSYIVLERQLIDKVLEENRFQSGGLVDDSQISEIGKQMGANVVFVSSIASMGSNLYISCKMIDVQTARIEKQRTALTQKGQTDLIAVVQRVVGDMFADVPKSDITRQQPAKQVVEEKPAPSITAKMLTAKGKRVYQGAMNVPKYELPQYELERYEVRQLMANTYALQLYEKGIKRNRNGNIWIITGTVLFASGCVYLGIIDNDPFEAPPGAAALVVGGTMMLTGIILKPIGKSNIRNSVNAYNSGLKRTGMELKFGITGNGVGVALVF